MILSILLLQVIRSHSLKLLSTLLEAEGENPSILEVNRKLCSCIHLHMLNMSRHILHFAYLQVDVFSLMVSLTYSLPSLFNGEGPAPLPSCNIQVHPDSKSVVITTLQHRISTFCAWPSWPT